MPMSHDVALSKDADPVFPSRCVVCLADRPDDLYIASARAFFLISVFLPFLRGRKFEVEIPCCRDCRAALTKRKRTRNWSEMVGVLVPLGLIIGWTIRYDVEHAKRWIGLGALVFVSPWVWLHVARPLAFNLTATRKAVGYEFANEEYATEFAELNDAEVE